MTELVKGKWTEPSSTVYWQVLEKIISTDLEQNYVVGRDVFAPFVTMIENSFSALLRVEPISRRMIFCQIHNDIHIT